jgi:hypothetical protein
MKFIKLLFCSLLFTSLSANASDLTDEQQLKEKHLLLQAMELNNVKTPKALSNSCLVAPLPSTPKTPNYSMSYKDFSGDTVAMTFWREPCQDGTGSALLVRATPTGSPFLCSSSFKIIQNAIQMNSLKLQPTPNSNSWCDDLFVGATMIIDQYDFGDTQFNPAKALTLVFEEQLLEIPAGSVSGPSIVGSAAGYKNYKVTCKNIKTGVVKTFKSQTATEWNCNGLAIKSGEIVKTTLTGVAK